MYLNGNICARKNELPMLTDPVYLFVCLGKVSDKKQLRGGLRIIEAIPKTPSGKLKKRDLPAMEAASNSST